MGTERDAALAAAKRSGSLEEWQKAWKMTPDGITDQEWTYYQNMDPRNMKPEIRNKVEAALGLRQDDVSAAAEIAGKVLGAVKIADAGAGEKGHVPEENLARYRRLRELSHLLSRMGNMVSGLGEHEDANKLWALGGKYKRMANELRADITKFPEEADGS